MNNRDRILSKLEKQLNISDRYAKDKKSKDDNIPSVWELQNGHIRDLLAELKEIAEKGCEYCGVGGWKTLFRIIETYPRGEEIDFAGECEECSDRNEDESNCGDCEYKPYQPDNCINVTIGVVGDKIMFEDKHNFSDGEYKKYVKINYCPICGRSL